MSIQNRIDVTCLYFQGVIPPPFALARQIRAELDGNQCLSHPRVLLKQLASVFLLPRKALWW